jgi:hypothetical protein
MWVSHCFRLFLRLHWVACHSFSTEFYTYLGGAQSCLVQSRSVPTYVFPRHVTFTTRTPVENNYTIKMYHKLEHKALLLFRTFQRKDWDIFVKSTECDIAERQSMRARTHISIHACMHARAHTHTYNMKMFKCYTKSTAIQQTIQVQ